MNDRHFQIISIPFTVISCRNYQRNHTVFSSAGFFLLCPAALWRTHFRALQSQ
jgi:hypothetical protein